MPKVKQMNLPEKQVLENYNKSFEFISFLLEHEINRKGYLYDSGKKEYNDLIQTIIGHENVVKLLQEKIFSQAVYEPVILKAMNETKKDFFCFIHGL